LNVQGVSGFFRKHSAEMSAGMAIDFMVNANRQGANLLWWQTSDFHTKILSFRL